MGAMIPEGSRIRADTGLYWRPGRATLAAHHVWGNTMRLIANRCQVLTFPLLALALALALTTAFAGEMPDEHEASVQAVADRPELTDDLIERYLASMRELQDLARSVEGQEDDIDAEQAQALQQEHAAILDEHGFDREEWMATHQRIFEAAVAVAVRMENVDGDVEADIEEQRERILAEPDLREEQREMMLDQIDQQLEVYRELQDNPDADVVEPYYDEFQEIFSGNT